MTDTTRDAFEAECRRYWGERCPDLEFKDYKYESGRAEIAYAFWQAATLTERERCAKVCDKISDINMGHVELQGAADAIRSGK